MRVLSILAALWLSSCVRRNPTADAGLPSTDMSAAEGRGDDLAVADDLAAADDLAVAGDLAWPWIAFDPDAGTCPFTPRPASYDLGAEICPSCFGDVVLSCVGAGACVSQRTTSGSLTVESRCYANGVREEQTTDTSGTWRRTRLVYNAGRLCFTSVESYASDRETRYTTYYDSCGHGFAQVGHLSPLLNAINCGGAPYDFKLPPGSCEPAFNSCTPGVCN